jgi:hypothetical protein
MIQKKSLKDAIQNPEIISVVGGLLGEKVTLSFPIMQENVNDVAGWVRLVSLKNQGSYSRDCSVIEVHAVGYASLTYLIILLGITHGPAPKPFIISEGGNFSYNIAYKKSEINTDVYIQIMNSKNLCIQKKWLTKSIELNIVSDSIEYIGAELPEGAVTI